MIFGARRFQIAPTVIPDWRRNGPKVVPVQMLHTAQMFYMIEMLQMLHMVEMLQVLHMATRLQMLHSRGRGTTFSDR